MVSQSCWVLLLLCTAAGFFGWLGLSTPLEEPGTPPQVRTPLCIPFEMATGDKQLQAEAMCWELSPLDSCHHQVVAQLHSSHGDLSEEEKVAKLGVDLFNCQANAEGHCMYPCTLELEQPTGWLRPRLEMSIHRSLQQPVLDETLIASGQHRVAQPMEDITQQMGNVSSQGATGLREGHRLVLSDLHHEQERAQDIYSQLESDLALLLAQQRRMEEVMEKLQRVNQSLGLMLAAVEGAQNQLENHLENLHPAGQSPSAISTFILHGSYFALLVALLVPMPPRAILLLLAFGVLGELLGIPALSTLLVLAMAGQLLVVATRYGAGGAWLVLPQEEPHHQLTSTPDRALIPGAAPSDGRGHPLLSRTCVTCPQQLEDKAELVWGKPELGVMQEPPMGAGKRWEPKPCSPSQSLASDTSSLSPRLLCQGLTRARRRCRKKAIPGQDFCHVHATGQTSCSGLAVDSSPHI
ncbi:PREDICTED: protein brambleberry-like [Charadrius vociferus]|uniref:protein brambleberry-like n=1 Tax=Charadrius vociferus TaxID=50402 RepID=UPI000521B27D|nr:PREDICTED: protein brambleberry-like [Charadrius vociferus]